MTIYVGVVFSDTYGAEIFCSKSKVGAERKIVKFCKKNWKRAATVDFPDPFRGMSDCRVLKDFFDFNSDCGYRIEKHRIEE